MLRTDQKLWLHLLRFPFVFKRNPFRLALLSWQEGCWNSQRVMKNQKSLLALFVLLSTGLSAQQAPAPSKEVPGGPLLGERDRVMEDQVAKLFETIRVGAKLPRLWRIKHHERLEQEVCTMAQTGTFPIPLAGVYKTLRPDLISPELRKTALFNGSNAKSNPNYERYSVAVWRTTDAKSGKPTYWVAIALFPSAALEFFWTYFTDDVFFRNNWKEHIATQCRGN
jgi:hypothetical protein